MSVPLGYSTVTRRANETNLPRTGLVSTISTSSRRRNSKSGPNNLTRINKYNFQPVHRWDGTDIPFPSKINSTIELMESQ